MTVTVICDPGWLVDEDALANLAPVWIVESPRNRHLFEHLIAREIEVTIFNGSAGPESSCADILATVEEHHGPLSSRVPCTTIRVIGAQVTSEIESVLGIIGFRLGMIFDDGFAGVRKS